MNKNKTANTAVLVIANWPLFIAAGLYVLAWPFMKIHQVLRRRNENDPTTAPPTDPFRM